MDGYVIGLAVGLCAGIAIGIPMGKKQRSWSELNQREKNYALVSSLPSLFWRWQGLWFY